MNQSYFHETENIHIGVSSNENSFTIGSFVSEGKFGFTVSTLSFNSRIAEAISTFDLNCMTIEDTEFFEVDVIVSIHFIFAISFSNFFVTRSSIISGLAHGSMETTLHIHICTSGFDSRGKDLREISHAIVTIMTKSIINLVLSKKNALQDELSFSSYFSWSRYLDFIVQFDILFSVIY